MRRQQQQIEHHKVELPQVNQLNPYELMRIQNCKSFKFRKGETYPSIKPPISQCHPEQTDNWIAKSLKASGCESQTNPQTLNNNRNAQKCPENLEKVYINTSEAKYIYPERRRKQIPVQNRPPYDKLDWTKLTPNELMRMQNCKTFKFYKEIYPSIRPPVSRCSDAQTAEWLADSVEQSGCRFFNMEQDDVLEAWKQSPHKHTLGFYGIGMGSNVQPPEALVFNQMITKCLNKVSGTKRLENASRQTKRRPPKRHKWPCGSLVLNRQLLQSKICNMPQVQKELKAERALTLLYCPKPMTPKYPFIETQTGVSLKAALDMERPFPKAKHGIRKKYKYCEPDCGIPLNKCTEYEWLKYKQDQKRHEAPLQLELAAHAIDSHTQPRNYDELYSEMITCFEDRKQLDPFCRLYEKCCVKSRKDGSEGGAGGPGGPGGGHKPKPKPGHGTSDSKDDSTSDSEKQGYGPGGGPGDRPDGGPGDRPGGGPGDRPGGGPGDRPGGGPGDKPGGGPGDGIGDGTGDRPGKKPGKRPGEEHGKPQRPGKGKPGKPGKPGKGDGNRPSDKTEWGPDTGRPSFKPPYKPDLSDDMPDGLRPDVKRSDDRQIPDDLSDTDLTRPSPSKEGLTPGKPGKPTKPHKPQRPLKPGEEKPSKKPHKPFKPSKPKPHRPKPSETEPIKDCPCPVCEFMKRRDKEPDTPCMRHLKEQDKRRQLRDYYKRMCHMEYVKRAKPKYYAPQRKCDPIVCDNCFCKDPKLGEYCDCLSAMQHLQKLLGPKHQIKDNQLIFDIEDLRNRICKRFCDCL